MKLTKHASILLLLVAGALSSCVEHGSTVVGNPSGGKVTEIKGQTLAADGASLLSRTTVYVPSSSTSAGFRSDHGPVTKLTVSCGDVQVSCNVPAEDVCAQTCSCPDGSYSLNTSLCPKTPEVAFCSGISCHVSEVDCATNPSGCAVDLVNPDADPWTRVFGDPNGQANSSTALDREGNVITAGYFDGLIDFGGGPHYYPVNNHRPEFDFGTGSFVAKFNFFGEYLWSKSFGDVASAVQINNVATDGSGNVILTGSFQGTVDFGGGPLTNAGERDDFIVKLDADGKHMWSKRWGSGYSIGALSAAADSEDNILVTGGFGGSAAFTDSSGKTLLLESDGEWDVFLVKSDPAGGTLWAKRFGGAEEDYGSRVSVDSNDAAVLTGVFSGSADFGGGSKASKGYYDIFLAKFGPAGDHLWDRRFGTVDFDNAHGLAIDSRDNAVLTGNFKDGPIDFGGGDLVSESDPTYHDIPSLYLAKFGPDGGHLWSRQFGHKDSLESSGNNVAVDYSDDIILVGYYSGVVDLGNSAGKNPMTSDEGGFDILLAKFDGDGSTLWSKSFRGYGSEHGNDAIAVDRSNNIVMGGTFSTTLDFGDGPVSSAGRYDAFLVKLLP